MSVKTIWQISVWLTNDTFWNTLSPYSTINSICRCNPVFDRYEYAGIVLMDLSKTFDALPHAHLIVKMKVTPPVRWWKATYHCIARCWRYEKKGVPQGSICSTDYFNNYVDDNTLSKINKGIDVGVENVKHCHVNM